MAQSVKKKLKKSTFESRESTAMGAAILYLSVCACDVMNKVGMCIIIT